MRRRLILSAVLAFVLAVFAGCGGGSDDTKLAGTWRLTSAIWTDSSGQVYSVTPGADWEETLTLNANGTYSYYGRRGEDEPTAGLGIWLETDGYIVLIEKTDQLLTYQFDGNYLVALFSTTSGSFSTSWIRSAN